MVKVLIWQVSNNASFRDNALKILERQYDGIEIIGEASNADIAKVDVGGGYDIILCVGAKQKQIGMSKVTKDAVQLNMPEEKLLGDWIVCIPGFTLEKYRLLQQSQLSILSLDCSGGLFSNFLGLRFNSPTVNLNFPPSDYMKFLHSPQNFIEKELHFEKMVTVPESIYSPERIYPLFSIQDILIRMIHYKTPEEALAKWNERKQRINFSNLLCMMYTRDKDLLEEFDALPYSKKICFVPFKSDLASAWYISPKPFIEQGKKRLTLGRMVRGFATGVILCYDPFDMLLYGKKTQLIDM